LGVVHALLVSVATLFVPPRQSRRKLARNFKCHASMVPEALLYYAAIYSLAGLIIPLCLRDLALICLD
jgi:hypothetical protein